MPAVESLRFISMPAMSLSRMVEQADNYEQPLAFPIIRQLPHFQSLRVLSFESPRSRHPNFVTVLSTRVFLELVNEILPLMPLEDLNLTDWMLLLDGQIGGRRVAEKRDLKPLPLEPFLKLHRLRKLRLSVVSCRPSLSLIGAPSQAVNPLILDLRQLPSLEELDLHFNAAEEDEASAGLTAPSEASTVVTEPSEQLRVKCLGPKLRRLCLTGLGPSVSGLRPSLARAVVACPCLEHVVLSGPRLPEDFMLELCKLSAQRSAQECLRFHLDWVEAPRVSASPQSPNGGTARNHNMSQELSQHLAGLKDHGVSFQVSSAKPCLDLRFTSATAARLEQKLNAGLSSYGDGMDWFLGGVPPAPLSVGQSAVINNRYS